MHTYIICIVKVGVNFVSENLLNYTQYNPSSVTPYTYFIYIHTYIHTYILNMCIGVVCTHIGFVLR